jgi:hypothetical protein
VTRWYHCITRCVRRALLLGEGPDDRKEWIERRLQELGTAKDTHCRQLNRQLKDSQ